MRLNTHSSFWVLPALALCATLTFLAAPARASTLTTLRITGIPTGNNEVGPYQVSTTTDGPLLVFCLDENLSTIIGADYLGVLRSVSGPQEQEAAFLAAYALFKGAPTPATTIEADISNAIWEIMGTFPTISPLQTAQAAPYLQLAQSAYNNGQISTAFLDRVQVFVPDNTSAQRFVVAVRDDQMFTPEPGTWVFLATGIGLIALGRRRSRA